MLKDAKISTKVIIGFGLALLVAAVIGFVGRQSLVASVDITHEIAGNRMPSMYGLQEMAVGQLHVAAGQRGLAMRRMMDAQSRQGNYAEIERGLKQLAEGRRLYESLPMEPEEARIWQQLVQVLDNWQRSTQSIGDLQREKDTVLAQGQKIDDPAVLQLDDRTMQVLLRTRDARNEASKLLDELIALNNDLGKRAAAAADASASRSSTAILLVLLLGLGLVIAAATVVIRGTNTAIHSLRSEAARLAEAAINGQLATRGDVMAVPQEFRPIVQGVNDTLDAVIQPLNVAADYVDNISKGNIPAKITDRYNGDFNTIKNNLNTLVDTLNRFIAEMGHMAQQHDAGDIDVMVPEDQFVGSFKVMAKGVNDMVKGHISVKKKAMACIAQFANGNFDAELERFPGKKAFINDNVEVLRKNSKALIDDAIMLSRAAVEGKLSTRADAQRHQGDYRKIVQGVNDTLNAVIGPLSVAADYVDKISKGNIPSKITDNYNGDFNAIKNNLNQCIDAIQKLVADSAMLSKAAVEGKLATRADASRHDGDFRRIVQGVNDTLDAVIGPLNVAADYVDKISKGNIPPKINENYSGDFNAIKLNLNQCIDAVTSLVADAQSLAEAAIEGRLATRADATKHAGDFRRIVEGVNKTLDAVVNPIMEATQVLETLAQYDLRARVVGNYSGDHARIKTALNGTGKALHDALTQVADAVEQVSEASRQIASSSQSVAQGASEQASSLEETSSSLEEMASMTKQNADNTVQARSLAQSTKEAAEKGGQAMSRMIDAMEKIRAAAEGTAQIIKDINEIAFQTNLLALNAAVEAARAGDAGRGFAVVAEEVRNLALRSKEAAKKTEDLIKMSVGHAENGRVISGEVAGSLNEIVSAAGKVNDIVSEIAVASQEQSRGIEQVNTAVSEMDKVVQVAAANAEESSSAAEELSSQSEELTGLVGRFVLDRDSSKRNQKRELLAADQRRKATGPSILPRRATTPQQSRPRQVVTSTNRKVTPEEAIPFEDPEFRDF
ncbi:MAG: methyl-accepting chemotaxis protein [Anaeromyxobacter sp.]